MRGFFACIGSILALAAVMVLLSAPGTRAAHPDAGVTGHTAQACRVVVDGGVKCITVYLLPDSGWPAVVLTPDGERYLLMGGKR